MEHKKNFNFPSSKTPAQLSQISITPKSHVTPNPISIHFAEEVTRKTFPDQQEPKKNRPSALSALSELSREPYRGK